MSAPARHKFNAKRAERGGLKFDSQAEARYFDELMLRQLAGEVLFFLRQVRFDLPGGVVYRADFMVFESNGNVRVVDVKGVSTESFRAKRRMVEALYPIAIELVGVQRR